jgi:hypothetical protein
MVAEGYGEGVGLPRFLTQPIPPASTEAGVTFLIRFGLALGLILAAAGVLYATGLAGSNRLFGVGLFVSSLCALFPCWMLWRLRARMREES